MSEIVGLSFVAQHTPFSTMSVPPVNLILPPVFADVWVILVTESVSSDGKSPEFSLLQETNIREKTKINNVPLSFVILFIQKGLVTMVKFNKMKKVIINENTISQIRGLHDFSFLKNEVQSRARNSSFYF
jgi:hypothetical protein